MKSAEDLRQRLKATISVTFSSMRPLGKPEAIAKVLQKFERQFGTATTSRPSRQRILEAVRIYLEGGLAALDGPRLRHLCWGLAEPLGTEEPPLIEQSERFAALSLDLEGLARGGRLSFPAWRGLFICYFSLDADRARDSGRAGWIALRKLLSTSVDAVFQARVVRRAPPRWLATLHENRSVLSDRPYEGYTDDWLRGDVTRTNQLKADLEIPDHSWFWDWLVAATVVKGTRKAESEFRELIPSLIDLIAPRDEFIRDRGLTVIVDRFSTCSDKSIHQPLLDYATQREVWGSPRVLNSPRWGRVREDARKLVASWMNERNLRDFFDVLSRDPHTDKDRLNFWMRYIERIDDSYIALGSEARFTSKAAFKDLRWRPFKDWLNNHHRLVLKLYAV